MKIQCFTATYTATKITHYALPKRWHDPNNAKHAVADNFTPVILCVTAFHTKEYLTGGNQQCHTIN